MARSIRVIIGSLEIGGTERHLSMVLPRLHRQGWDIEVVTLIEKGALAPELEAEGVPVQVALGRIRLRRLPALVRRVLLTPVVIARLALRMARYPEDITWFLLPEAYLLGSFAHIISRSRSRTVMSRRSLAVYQRKYPLVARLERWFHKRTSLVLANSEAVADELRSEGVEAARLSTVRNGLELASFEAARTAHATSDTAALRLICVANLIAYKGHADLLDSLALIAPELPQDWELICVGDGPERKTLQLQAHSLSLSAHVHWLGVRRDVPSLLASASIGILSSHEEGMPNAVVEYLAAGLPVVATAVGGTAELVTADVGVLVAPDRPEALARAIIDLVLDSERRETMSRAAVALAQQHRIESSVERYESVFLDLLTPVR